MRFARLAVGACAVAALAGCTAAPAISHSADTAVETTPPSAGGAAPSVRQDAQVPLSATLAPFGSEHTWGNGLAVTISAPKSLTPSDTAFPRAGRMAVFTVVVLNGTSTVYRPPQLAVRAVADGRPAQEVLDAVQGLNGVASAVQELPPERDATLTLAFAVPDEPVRMRLTVQPGGGGSETMAIFEGTA
ncbi:hypothetical protein [Umezawaea beigongshangensis]|uniref:hypothetical protein n=1 Tax=Umezawaea beigongshangensis TaxID=2780383 RepID=UPI0018F21D49|nr:hypothetical protein [Umezawaea beigongshangensis]